MGTSTFLILGTLKLVFNFPTFGTKTLTVKSLSDGDTRLSGLPDMSPRTSGNSNTRKPVKFKNAKKVGSEEVRDASERPSNAEKVTRDLVTDASNRKLIRTDAEEPPTDSMKVPENTDVLLTVTVTVPELAPDTNGAKANLYLPNLRCPDAEKASSEEARDASERSSNARKASSEEARNASERSSKDARKASSKEARNASERLSDAEKAGKRSVLDVSNLLPPKRATRESKKPTNRNIEPNTERNTLRKSAKVMVPRESAET